MTAKRARSVAVKKRAPKKARADSRVNGAPQPIKEIATELERPPAKLRGLMPTPPEVQAMMDEMFRDLPISDSFRRLQTDYLNEQYYFGGNTIAYRNTSKGREILAVGWAELEQLE